MVDEERYDIEAKVMHNTREVNATQTLSIGIRLFTVLLPCGLDQRPEHQGCGPTREVQATQPSAGEGLGRRHPPLAVGLQAQSVHGSASQP